MSLSKKEFLIKADCPKVDITISSDFLKEFDLADKFGTRFRMKTLREMLSKLDSLGTHLDTSTVSYVQGKFVLGKHSVEDVETIAEGVVQEAVHVPEVSEEVVEEVVESIEEVKEASEDSVEVEWDWINSLVDNKDSKLQLDQYAENTFGIKLKRNMKLENMISIFKEKVKEL